MSQKGWGWSNAFQQDSLLQNRVGWGLGEHTDDILDREALAGVGTPGLT